MVRACQKNTICRVPYVNAPLDQNHPVTKVESGRAGPGPDTLWTLARALDGLFAVLTGTLEPGDSRHCADRVLVRTVRCLHRARRVRI